MGPNVYEIIYYGCKYVFRYMYKACSVSTRLYNHLTVPELYISLAKLFEIIPPSARKENKLPINGLEPG